MATIVDQAVKTAFFDWLMNEGAEPFLASLEKLLHQAAAGVPALTGSGPEPVKTPTKT